MSKKLLNIIKPQLPLVKEQEQYALALPNKIKLSLYKKSNQSGISVNILEEVYRRGYFLWNESFKGNRQQFAYDRVNSFIAGGFAADLDRDLIERNLDVPTPSPEDLSKKYSLPLKKINKLINQGAKVEKEHTTSEKNAREIARDHIGEKPKYYKLLKKYVECVEPTSTDSNNPASRFIGSDELTDIYRKDTPGQLTKVIKQIAKQKNESK